MPRRHDASRTALAALQAQALWEAQSSQGLESIAARLYMAAAERGHEHLAAAADRAAYRAGVQAGILPAPPRIASVVTRKRWTEYEAVRAIGEGVRQAVVLGAGFDTLGIRLLRRDPDLVVIELDRADTIEAKRRALDTAAIERPWPRLVCGDLANAVALGPTLSSRGWRAPAATFFVAEVVLEYLAPEEALAVLSEVARLGAPGSRFACTVRFGNDPADDLAAATAAAGEPMRFRPPSEALPDLVVRAGFDIVCELERPSGRGGATALLLLAPVGRR
jgi:methyltransferase (TIGR00027 family)